jgi:hypothetical protein
MYAALATVSITDDEEARRILHDDVLPTITEVAGFVAGHWLAPVQNRAMSILIFETEDEACAMAAQMPTGRQLNEFTTVVSVEVCEVAGSVHQLDPVPLQMTPES